MAWVNAYLDRAGCLLTAFLNNFVLSSFAPLVMANVQRELATSLSFGAPDRLPDHVGVRYSQALAYVLERFSWVCVYLSVGLCV
jgi:hypothetical protein